MSTSMLRHRILTREQEAALALRIQAGDPNAKGTDANRARNALVEANLRFAVQQATRNGKHHRYGLTFDDAVQCATLGLIHAAGKFDAVRGTKFVTYAAYWIRCYLERGRHAVVRGPMNKPGRDGKVVRDVGAHTTESTEPFDLMLAWRLRDDPYPDAERGMDLGTALDATELTTTEETILRTRARGETLETTGKEIDLSRERARQIEAGAVVRMKEAVA